jgi:predicted amidophosphoribosyltransferase
MIDYVVRRLRETDPAELRGLFGPSTTLVPVPRSCLMKPDTLWVPARICQRLVAEGLARETVPCLVRATELPRSAGATVRPSASEHYDSLAVERDLLVASVGPMTLVDDVVTRGATLLAAVSLLEESFAGTDVRALALIRTMSAGEVESVLSPCVGTIKDRGGNRLRREP